MFNYYMKSTQHQQQAAIDVNGAAYVVRGARAARRTLPDCRILVLTIRHWQVIGSSWKIIGKPLENHWK